VVKCIFVRRGIHERHQTVASESTASEFPSAFLQELILDSADVEEFLDGLSRFSSRHLSAPGDEVLCGVTLLRQRKAATVASSTEHARHIDEIQYGFGDGPCMTASREQLLVSVPDTTADRRWSAFTSTLAEQGIRSILAVPFELDSGSNAALNLYSHRPNRFDAAAVDLVCEFVRQSSLALRLAVRFAQQNDAEVNLRATLESRTSIDLAVGIIMAQNRCSQESAFEMLKAASSTRNVKLREVAARIVSSIGQGPATTHYVD
jgi:GAF domain-containing protein